MSETDDLPVQQVLPNLMKSLVDHSAVILRAPPGAGKTTLVPLALMHQSSDRRVLLTQPRRLAARSVAARISQLNGTELGQAIGYQVRMDRRWGRSTRTIAVTTGVLLRWLLNDPFLDDFSVVVLDEFHERTLALDLALGMILRLQQTVRPDLKLVVMSATIDCGPIADFLGSPPVIESSGRQFEVSMRYVRQVSRDPIEQRIVQILPQALAATPGHLLIFLPGVGEIVKTDRAIQSLASQQGCRVWQLFGDMSSVDQDRVLAPSDTRKIILATNVAETSLTIDGVSGVIDSGLVRVMRFNADLGLPRLELESNSVASSDQRAGRAGRQQPGVCFRLWPESAQRGRPDFDTPEILRCDLSGALLQLAGMGETATEHFPWLTPPPPEAVETARTYLHLIGALADQRITAAGRRLLAIPASPRLAQLLMKAAELGIPDRGAWACALLSERDPFRTSRHDRSANHRPGSQRPMDRSTVRSASDLVDKVTRLEETWAGQPDPDLHRGSLHFLHQAAQHLLESCSEEAGNESSRVSAWATPSPRLSSEDSDDRLRLAIFHAYPDRLVKRRQPGSDRGLMVGGTGVQLSRDSSVLDADLLVAIDVQHRDRDSEVRMASGVELEWLPSAHLRTEDEYFFHPTQKAVQARRRTYFLDLPISENPIAASDPTQVQRVLYDHVLGQWSAVDPSQLGPVRDLLQRLAMVREVSSNDEWPAVTDEFWRQLAWEICQGRRSFEEVRFGPWLDYLQGAIGYDRLARLNQWVPSEWTAPSGNRVPIVYESGRPPKISVRLQELFGLAETPSIVNGRIPLLLELLGPNYRPQQLTSDLASFWKNTYPVVRKELARRYPKHHWPDDPLTTSATRSGLKRDVRH